MDSGIGRWNPALLALIALLAVGCQRAPWHESLTVESAEVGAIPNASRVGDRLIFGAQPTEADFEILSNAGIKTVLNLRTAQEMADVSFNEEAAAHHAGMSYLNIPVGREPPSRETIELIQAVIADESRHPIFVHCASSNRVGYAWALYRGTRGGLSEDDAVQEGKLAGMRSPVLEQWAREYIRSAQPE
jgi:uncharacterized protein (TIGR01244 family)